MQEEANQARPSRRNLLLGLGGGAVAAAAAAAPILDLTWVKAASKRPSSWWDRTFFSLRNGGVDDWSRLAGETFTLGGEKGALTLKLAAVKSFPGGGVRPASLGRSKAFAAVFEGAGTAKAPEGDRIYQLTHRLYPPIEIYMSPTVRNGAKVQLLAIFN